MGVRVPWTAGKRVAYHSPGVADLTTSGRVCGDFEPGGLVPGTTWLDCLIVDVLGKTDFLNIIHKKPLLSLLTGVVIFVIGILISDIPKMIVSRGWPATEGTILNHRFVAQKFKEYDGDFYTSVEVQIRYQYAVNGISYTSKSINSLDTPFNLYPSRYAYRYPVGGEVIVYYNPNNPSEAVLEPGFVNVYKAFDVFSYILFGSGIIFLCYGISMIKKRKFGNRNLK